MQHDNAYLREQFWWHSDNGVLHERIFAAVEYLDEHQSYRRLQNLHHLKLYSSRLSSGLSGGSYNVLESGDRIRVNVVKSVIDAAVAHIASNRPKVMFKTEGGSIKDRKQAERLGKFAAGQTYALRRYETALDVFRDACIFGTGFEKIYEREGEIFSERVFPDEIIIDDSDAKYGKPRQMFHHKEIERDVLIELYPEHKDAIKNARLIRDDAGLNMNLSDPVSAIEAWHLPSKSGSDDGRHAIVLSTVTIDDSDWELDRFPFSEFRWSTAPLGYFGVGLAEELSSLQIEINYLLQKMQRLLNAVTTTAWVQKGSGISKLSNKDMAVREYRGAPPVFQSPAPFSPEFRMQVEFLYQKAFELAGISQLAAQGQKPAGLSSGEALRVYNDVGSRRFQHVGQRWEQYHLDATDLMLDRARDIEGRDDGDIDVLTQGDDCVERIKFSEVSIDKNKYSMKAWPVSLLPDSPAGKIDAITQLAQVSPSMGQHALKLMGGIPDLEAVVKLETAPQELVETMVEAILEHGEMEPPYPSMDLEYARYYGTRMLALAHLNHSDEENIDMLRNWIALVDEYNKPPEPAQPISDAMSMEPQGPPQMQLPPDPLAAAMPPMV